MQFLDEVKVCVRSGSGGAGCVSFRRERNVPRGGPDGGHGGKGGDVRVRTARNLNTLVDYRFARHFSAQNGTAGSGRQCHGKNGDDLVLNVPIGTQILEEDKETLVADLIRPDQEVLLLKGGIGGLGNTAFKTSTRRTPRHAQAGRSGYEKWFWFSLKLIADVGIVGMPNAGKSTLLGCISRSHPKVGDYPFTTLTPQLGIVEMSGHSFVVADIPGLIEGAHEGLGLGDTFLKHVERCSVLLCVIDITQADVVATYEALVRELALYHPSLGQKARFVVLSKGDLVDSDQARIKKKALGRVCGRDVPVVSRVAQQSLLELVREVGMFLGREFRRGIPRGLGYEPPPTTSSGWHPLDG